MKRSIKPPVFLVLLFVVFLGFVDVWTAGADDYDTKNYGADIPKDIQIDVFFCPRDGCFSELTKHIVSANSSVHCAFFDLKNEDIAELLKKRSKEIDVKLVIDDTNYKFKELDFVKKDTSSQLMHNKFCIFDNRVVWTGSFNPTERGAYYNNNNIVILYSEEVSSVYEDEFNELWDGYFGRKSRSRTKQNVFSAGENKEIEIYFCPEDWCTNKVLKELDKAGSSIKFMVFSFTHESVAEILVKKHMQGVKVQGVTEKSQNTKWSQHGFLVNNSIDAKLDNNPYNMHHKVFIIDNSTVITGSYNPSRNAENNNDENLVIIHSKEIAELFLKEFEYIFNT